MNKGSIPDNRCEACDVLLVEVFAGEPPSRTKKRKACSKECRDELSKRRRKRPREVKPCENCGDLFESITTDGKPSRFCKQACFFEHRSRTYRAAIAGRTEKPCGHCGVVKPLSEYHINVRYADGHHNICKPCQIIHTNDWALQANFGITRDQYNEILEAQGGVCAICHQKDRSGRRLAVDHDHATGEVRELLCGGCNTGIGNFRENAIALENAAAYIRRHKGEQ